MTGDAPDLKPADLTTDGFLGGLVTLRQPRGGHRAGLDAALLQALVPADAEGLAIDLGAGSGAVAFAVAARCPGMRVTAVEREPHLAEAALLALSLAENAGFAGRVRMLEADVTARRGPREAIGLADGSADWVLMNPPYDVPGRQRASPDPARRDAHVGPQDTLADWSRTAAGLLKPGGRMGIVHRASALPQILQALAGRFGAIRVVPVYPSPAAPASRVLVSATLGSRAAMQLMPGLVLHRDDGGWTAAADAILRGTGRIAI